MSLTTMTIESDAFHTLLQHYTTEEDGDIPPSPETRRRLLRRVGILLESYWFNDFLDDPEVEIPDSTTMYLLNESRADIESTLLQYIRQHLISAVVALVPISERGLMIIIET